MSAYDGGLFSPQTVLDEMNAVDSAITTLGEEILGSGVGETFQAKYARFLREWQRFYGAHDSGLGAWVSRTLNRTYAQVLEYKERLNGWRSKFVAAGGEPVGPRLPTGPQGGGSWQRTGMALAIMGSAIVAYLAFRRG